jgi:hypothetical protein
LRSDSVVIGYDLLDDYSEYFADNLGADLMLDSQALKACRLH